MAVRQINRSVWRLFRSSLRDEAGLGDAQLLERFLDQQDEAAFESLLRRHGPMVFGVCRRLLGDSPDAEDAFQATFLVLVRKGASIMPREMVGSWLHGVAQRTALHARWSAGRRLARECQALSDPPQPQPVRPEWLDVLDEELGRLPPKYRQPIVLCDLEGCSYDQAAHQLGCPPGTLAGRLSRARQMLAQRLSDRGVGLTAGALAAALTPAAASAAVHPTLLEATLRSASLLAAGEAAATILSPPVAALTEGVIKAMLLTKVKSVVTGVLLLGLLGGAVLLPAHSALSTAESAQAQQSDPKRAAEIKKIEEEINKLRERLKQLEAPAKPDKAKPAAKSPEKTPTGSIKVAENLSKSERAKLAKITPEQAKAAALKAVKGGEADDVELKVEDGYLVYVVDVVVKDGKKEIEYEVFVDAGSGKVLSVKKEDEDDSNEDDSNEDDSNEDDD